MGWLSRILRTATAPLQNPPPVIAEASVADASSAGDLLHAGNALLAEGRLAEAAAAYGRAAAGDPNSTDAHVNWGFALLELQRPREALSALTRALSLTPDSYDGHFLVGLALSAQNDVDQALVHLRRATALKPEAPAGALQLGRLLHDVGRFAEAERVLRATLELNPESGDLHHFLGNVVAQQMRFHEALACYRASIALEGSQPAVLNNMGLALVNLCDYPAAAQAARAALRLDPQLHAARSNLLLALSCDAGCEPGQYLAEANAYGCALQGGKVGQPAAAGRAASGDGPVRVGFVSGDLRNHPVGYFLESVMANWDRTGMVSVAYSNHAAQDDLTARLRGHFDDWHDISRLNDDVAARLIADDRVDVLFDLSGHTAGNRLPLFAKRLAPVQVSWLGYWATTGVRAMDYVLADPVSVPIAEQAQFTERVLYMPDTRLCFTAPALSEMPEVSPLPALARGHITFGSFQRLTKINDGVLVLWSRVLRAVPRSRLRLQSSAFADESIRRVVAKRLEAAGIDSDRVTLAGPGSRPEYLAAHAEVDLLLDTFPHSGGTTTCEALWMGVPTITLAGRTMLSRQGASLLSCAGLGDWVAEDGDGYVDLAVRKAADLESLARLRASLRDLVSTSPLFDAARFTAALQRAILDVHRERVVSGSIAFVPATT